MRGHLNSTYHCKRNMLFLFMNVYMIFISKFFIANSTMCDFFIHVLSYTFYPFPCSWTTFTCSLSVNSLLQFYNLCFLHSCSFKYFISVNVSSQILHVFFCSWTFTCSLSVNSLLQILQFVLFSFMFFQIFLSVNESLQILH